MDDIQNGPNLNIVEVLTVFKCHFDAGFTNTESKVLQDYFTVHFPTAISVAAELYKRGEEAQYVWTMPAWLLYEYLEECSIIERTKADEAIERGWLSWHALPLTYFSEIVDRSVFETALSISARLDRRYEKRTRSARFTDIPGHTRGVIQPLVDAGVDFLNIGANPGCQPPRVPKILSQLPPMREFDRPDPDSLAKLINSPVAVDMKLSELEISNLSSEGINDVDSHLFRWRNSSGSEMTVLYHPYAYGSTVRIPDTNIVTSVRVHGDNSGAHSVESVGEAFRSLRAKFPNAALRAVDLNDVADQVATVAGDLPILESEIGDSWIYGVASDPWKNATFRSIMRSRSRWIADGRLDKAGEEDVLLVRQLIRTPEHNWGLSTSDYLRSRAGYDAGELSELRASNVEFEQMDREWAAQRQHPIDAIQTLRPDLREEALNSLEQLTAVRPDLSSCYRAGREVVLDNGLVRASITAHNLLESLRDLSNGREWATTRAMSVVYEIFNNDDYRRFARAYSTNLAAENDFGKQGLPDSDSQSGAYFARPSSVWIDRDDPLRCVALLDFRDDEPVGEGCPGEVWVEFRLKIGSTDLDVTAQIFDKTASRRPEALWVSFAFEDVSDEGWTITKLDEPIDPRDVTENAGALLHGTVSPVVFRGVRESIAIKSADAPLVAFGDRALLEFDNRPIRPSRGTHFNVYNNLWGTAFPQWNGEEMRFHFTLSLKSSDSSHPA